MREPPKHTPDGRYIIVRGRLWRAANPHLPEADREAAVRELMRARRAIAAAQKSSDDKALAAGRVSVQAAKVALGERGRPWWTDGAPDYNRRLLRNTPYATSSDTEAGHPSSQASRPPRSDGRPS